MLPRIIEWSVSNRLIVIVLAAFVVAAGILVMRDMPLEALPDLSDVQVIVQTDYAGQAPMIVEDQVTYPIASEMLKVPGAQTVRGYSFFGVSFVYVIFEDGVDLYWARSRVLEYLSAIRSKLPPAAETALGPDATGLGWIYQYVLVDTTGARDLADLRSIQDWYLRYQLTAVPGVSEVASVGGFERMYEVTVDPMKLRGYGTGVTKVMSAIRASNEDVGAMMVELSEREFMVRSLGYLQGIEDLENVVVGSTETGIPIRVADVANVQLAPDVRRGVADLDGRGDVVAGIVVMRFGENALATIERVKAKLAEIESGLPEGVVLKPVYDRSGLIHRAIGTLKEKLLEETIVVALVCLVFLFHARSALVAILTLPLGILMAFIAMRFLGVGADIMSLGGIAIAIGAMIDAAIVMIENMHKHLEKSIGEKLRKLGEAAADAKGRLSTSRLTPAERWGIVVRSSKEVGPALFFSLLIITVSFLPVFTLEAQEGRLFKPLAWTKTLAMASASLLSVTVVPVAMGLFVRGRIHAERTNPVARTLERAYRPVLDFVLRYRWPVVGGALAVVILTAIPYQRIGSEFMPPLNEGTVLYMPTTLPGISVSRASAALQRQDSILASIPEVETVFGKAGRATTATDPAGLDMFETTITLKPEEEWRKGMNMERLIEEMDEKVAFPGFTNAWTMPIKGRIDMLATGIRTPVGIKIFGEDLAELERIGRQIESAIRGIPGTRSVFAERAVSGYYLDIDLDREGAARYGLNIEDVQAVVQSAIGGMSITQTVEGRERYGVRLRYPHEMRDQPEKLEEVLIQVRKGRASGGLLGATALSGGGGFPGSGSVGGGTGGMDGSGSAPTGGMTGGGMEGDMAAMAAGTAQIPLGQIATIREVSGPMAIKTEGAFPTAWVFVDVEGRDIGGYVADAKRMVDDMVTLPPGYSLQWSGQYEYMQRAKEKLKLVVPATLLIILLLLYFNFRSVGETLIVMLSLPFALVGGVVFMAILGYNWSVATAIGFIALAGVAAEIGVVMLVYLGHAHDRLERAGELRGIEDVFRAAREGAGQRLRPVIMTATAVIGGLLPILWGHGTGASVMKRIAAPMVGGMVSATALTLLVIPVVWSLYQQALLHRRAEARAGTPPEPAPALLASDEGGAS
ncbi:MAG TPA: CusA/CzcA family heavy metal efflux RND transporter [Gemmatimonadota bacterium]|nr:CusA/CzcA family heavy metal efflux RND transporter [Gemmatimonadota bacterium]